MANTLWKARTRDRDVALFPFNFDITGSNGAVTSYYGPGISTITTGSSAGTYNIVLDTLYPKVTMVQAGFSMTASFNPQPLDIMWSGSSTVASNNIVTSSLNTETNAVHFTGVTLLINNAAGAFTPTGSCTVQGLIAVKNSRDKIIG